MESAIKEDDMSETHVRKSNHRIWLCGIDGLAVYAARANLKPLVGT